MRPQAQLGKRGYEVEWCANLPRNEFGDADIDNADYRFRDFASHEAAEKYARTILPQDAWGSVRITEFEYVPAWPGARLLQKEYVRDSEVYRRMIEGHHEDSK